MARRARLITSATSEPVTLAEAKLHLMIASAVTAHDDWITRAIASAREQYEMDTDTAVLASTWKQTYSHFATDIQLIKRPVSAIQSIEYVDMAGTTQTLDSTNYRLDSGSAQPAVEWDDLAVFPATDVRDEAVSVTYIAGYADAASVPADVKSNILLRVKREWELHAGVTDAQAKPLDRAIDAMTNRRIRSTYP